LTAMSLPLDLNPERTLIIDLPGPDLTPDQAHFLKLHKFGGVCLFARNISTPERTARLVHDIRAALGEHALIATDQEGGAVLRRLDVPAPPSGQALGLLGREDWAHEAGRIAARGLIELGINWNFAPSLDVNVNPLNPVIGERSFGADPAEVARLGVAWALGCEEAGVLSSVKHFPGHGDTAQDSHLTLPVVDKPIEVLERTEWFPFRAAAWAGVGSVMTAHIVYPALDPERPATLSHAALNGLLRERWGYRGIIVTDATDMHAISAHYPGGLAAPLALIAGADAVLSCGHGTLSTHADHAHALHRAIEAGELEVARVQEAISRLDQAAARFPGTPRPYPAEQRLLDETQLAHWAQEALRSVGELPRLNPAQSVLLIAPATAALGGPYGDFLSGETLAHALLAAFPHLMVALHEDDAGPALALLARFPDAPVLLATTGRWALSPTQLHLAEAVRSRQAIHLALWNTEHVATLALPALVTHGFRAANLAALVARLRTLE
jgi:beta-N-acetylhexosaminidase